MTPTVRGRNENESMNYREATPADAQAVASLHAESWRAAYREILSDAFLDGDAPAERLDFWRRRLAVADPDRYVLLAEEGTALRGFACVIAGADPRRGALLDNLHVRPGSTGQGLGTSLLLKAAEWVHTRDPASPLHLWVYEDNRPARRFYRQLGAIPAERVRKEFLGSGKIPLLCYVWPDLKPLLARGAESS